MELFEIECNSSKLSTSFVDVKMGGATLSGKKAKTEQVD
jgi:hypothetical protein